MGHFLQLKCKKTEHKAVYNTLINTFISICFTSTPLLQKCRVPSRICTYRSHASLGKRGKALHS